MPGWPGCRRGCAESLFLRSRARRDRSTEYQGRVCWEQQRLELGRIFTIMGSNPFMFLLENPILSGPGSGRLYESLL